jgi:hypothetical protein
MLIENFQLSSYFWGEIQKHTCSTFMNLFWLTAIEECNTKQNCAQIAV